MEQHNILVVEDDRNLAETIVYNLKQEGYRAGIARTGLEAIALTRSEQPDLLLLDVMLPEIDGFEVCRTIRASSRVPIIMLTAKDEEVDRVLGLELGADDYVVKPFSLRELLARIRATLRRVDMQLDGQGAQEPLIAGELHVWPGSRSVALGEDQIHLLPKEFDLLVYLMQNRGIVLSRRQLLEKVWGIDYFGDERTVDVHVRRLRMKIEPDPSKPCFIHTHYGVGYTFDGRPGRKQ
ncbi:MAG TPA: response regulator transcription factor [Chloroflexota bacterium]|nr:response regulator transcription factor [Chloroflexota bacterium]